MTRWSVVFASALLLCGLTAAQQTVVTNSGFATTPGPALSNATPTVTVPMAPQVSFVNRSASPVGATNATGGNVAGASNATIGNVPGVSNASIGVPVFATTQFTPNANLIAEEQVGPVTAPTGVANMGATMQVAVPYFNTGVAQFSSVYSTTSASGPDLAEVAAANRQKAQAQSVRTYTNDDIRRLNESTGVTTAAITPPPPGAHSPAAPEATAGVAGTTQSAGAAGGPASPFAPKAAISGSTGATSAGTSARSVTTEQSEETGAQSAAPAQPSATGTQSQPQGQLPATASPLPLYAILGLAAAAVGLLYFGFRQRAVSAIR